MASEASASFDRLAFYRYRVEVKLAQPLAVAPHHRAILWRGAFGSILRLLVCHDRELVCERCELHTSCAFPRIFAPSIPLGRPQIARLKSPPRPFVLGDPGPEATTLPRDIPLGLGLTVVGRAVDDLPHLVVALRRMGDVGIGPRRVAFKVESIRCLDASGVVLQAVYERGSDLIRPVGVGLRARDLVRPGDAEARRLRIRFVTPTELRRADAEAAGAAPLFGTLLRRARDRFGALATFFGDGPLDGDPRAIGELADGVRTVASEVMASGVVRRSSRTGQRHPVAGIVGTAVYEGESISELMPWIRLAEALGVGKHATFGNGRIEAQVVG